MTEYRVKKINLNKIGSTEDYLNAVKNASIHYCNGLKEVQNYCGGKLHRVNYGYCGINGNIEYVAERIK
jgi:hypothetical protein